MVLLTPPSTLLTVPLMASVAPPVPHRSVPGRLTLGALGVLIVGTALLEPVPEPLVPPPVPVEVPPPVPVPLLSVGVPADPPLDPPPPVPDGAEGVGLARLVVSATTARFSFAGPVWAAAGTASGPLVTDERPPATPEKPVPNPINAATTTGTANNAAPANPRATILRRHHASNPLLIRSPRRSVRDELGSTKTMRFNPSLTARLRIGFLVLFALLLVVSLLGVGRLFQIRVNYENDITRYFQLELENERLRSAFILEQAAARPATAHQKPSQARAQSGRRQLLRRRRACPRPGRRRRVLTVKLNQLVVGERAWRKARRASR